MKNNWKVKRLSEVLKVQNGYAFNSKLFTNETGTPLIRIRDLKNGLTTETKYRGDYDKRFEVKSGDFLIGMDGEFGCYEWKGDIALLNQRVCRLQDFQEALFPRFLFYRINGFLKAIEDVTGFTTVKHISSKQIEEIPIPLPPLSEQKYIVTILDEAFAAITTAKENTETNKKNSRALFESCLQSIFANPGDGWEMKTLSEVTVEFGRGKSKHRPRGDPKLLGGKYPLIQTGDVANSDHWITAYSQTYSEVGLAQSKLWPKGTVCIAIVGANVAESAILDFNACFPDSVIGIVVNEKIADNEYVEFLLQSFKAFLKEKGKGTARDNINLGTFENQRFPFPNLQTQKDIVSKINSIVTETQRLDVIYQQKLSSLEELKKSLLQKAFSGDLRGMSL